MILIFHLIEPFGIPAMVAVTFPHLPPSSIYCKQLVEGVKGAFISPMMNSTSKLGSPMRSPSFESSVTHVISSFFFFFTARFAYQSRNGAMGARRNVISSSRARSTLCES